MKKFFQSFKYILLLALTALIVAACAPSATTAPTAAPVASPTLTAQAQPTAAPSPTSRPTSAPTIAPTVALTVAPTAPPTNTPAPTATARPATTPPAAATAKVDIKLFQFNPNPLLVKVGTSVTWTNRDDIEHTITQGTPPTPSGVFDSDFISLGKSFSFTFTQPGDYPFFCRRHNSMTGVIKVVAP